MNAITKALAKVDDEIARIVGKLEAVAYDYNDKTGKYRHESYTRQGAQSLASRLSQVSSDYSLLANDEDGSLIPYAITTLEAVKAAWNDREDWRTGAFAANVAKAVERLVGLS